jgi:Tfp pilus assembly protein PilN
MSARKQKDQVNLLPQNEAVSSIPGRVLRWAMGTFRIIVIVTELIVMTAFLSRFWLDAKNTDLTDLMRQKQSIIAAAGDFESQFKLTQKKLEIFSQNAGEEGKASANLNTITSYLPENVYLTTYSYTDAQVSISGKSGSETDISQLIANLEKSDKFTGITLSNLSSDPLIENSINFELKLIPKD